MTHQFDLTEDQIAIQDMARKFTADRITPFAALVFCIGFFRNEPTKT